MTKNRGRYLAAVGGTLGICVSLGLFGILKGIISLHGAFIGYGYSVKQTLWISDPSTILAINTFSSTALAVIGIISAYRLSEDIRDSALVIIASGVAGFIFMGSLWIPTGFLLVIGGILIMVDN